MAERSALIVDDHPLFCDALALTLRAVAGFATVDTAYRLDAALDRLDGGAAPDVVVLDLDLPDVDGMGGLMRVRAATRAPVVVVSSLADDRVIAAAMAAGAAGFVPKHAGREAFRAAFEAVGQGRRYTPDGWQPPANTRAASEAVARLAQLTRQQARILELICQGMLNKQIAHDLAIAETTVKAHVTAIMRKLGVQSRTQAVLIAQEARFASLAPSG
ncbi:MAG: response regulator [Gemmobacter sp.]